MRNPPFSYEDKHPLREVKRGGGECVTDSDCGSDIKSILEQSESTNKSLSNQTTTGKGRGKCVDHVAKGMFGTSSPMPATGKVCSCHTGFTGPRCLALHHVDESPSAFILRSSVSPFRRIRAFTMPGSLLGTIIALSALLLALLMVRVRQQSKERKSLLRRPENGQKIRVPYKDVVGNSDMSDVSGGSI